VVREFPDRGRLVSNYVSYDDPELYSVDHCDHDADKHASDDNTGYVAFYHHARYVACDDRFSANDFDDLVRSG
jgi:hypothetical protein